MGFIEEYEVYRRKVCSRVSPRRFLGIPHTCLRVESPAYRVARKGGEDQGIILELWRIS